MQTNRNITATGWTVVLNAVLAACGIGLAVGNINSPTASCWCAGS
ncbi:hypothetical protein [Curtobacterium sp. MMLR14_010]|nr:hypothetical protein [Curtobacterium sp. MMLR14_010]